MIHIPFDNAVWLDIVDYYFDNIHWEGEDRSKYNKPADWIKDKFGGQVNLDTRTIDFESSKDCSWFVMRWGQ
jgi:hypothetical protein